MRAKIRFDLLVAPTWATSDGHNRAEQVKGGSTTRTDEKAFAFFTSPRYFFRWSLVEGEVVLLSHEIFTKQMRAAVEAGDVSMKQLCAFAESGSMTTRLRGLRCIKELHAFQEAVQDKSILYKFARFGWAASLSVGYHFRSPFGVEVMLIPHAMWCQLLRNAV